MKICLPIILNTGLAHFPACSKWQRTNTPVRSPGQTQDDNRYYMSSRPQRRNLTLFWGSPSENSSRRLLLQSSIHLVQYRLAWGCIIFETGDLQVKQIHPVKYRIRNIYHFSNGAFGFNCIWILPENMVR